MAVVNKMKLEINGEVVAEAADADDVKDALHDLNPEVEAFIVLSESEGVFLQAAGIPQTGYVMSYHNAQTGEELTSKNQTLKPMAVMRVLTAYARENADWRSNIGWEPMGAHVVQAYSWRAAWKRAWPLYVGMLFFAVAIVPLVVATKAVVDQVVYKPLCEQGSERQFDHFSHGSGNGNINVGYTPGRCWYTNGDNVALETIVKSGSVLIDIVGSITQVVMPIIIIVVIELVGFSLWRGRRKRLE